MLAQNAAQRCGGRRAVSAPGLASAALRGERTFRAPAAEVAPSAGAGSCRPARAVPCAAPEALQPAWQRRNARVKIALPLAASNRAVELPMRHASACSTHRALRLLLPRAQRLLLSPGRREKRTRTRSYVSTVCGRWRRALPQCRRRRGGLQVRRRLPSALRSSTATARRSRRTGARAGRALAPQPRLLRRGAQVLQLIVAHPLISSRAERLER